MYTLFVPRVCCETPYLGLTLTPDSGRGGALKLEYDPSILVHAASPRIKI